jgi:hypothetical protein
VLDGVEASIDGELDRLGGHGVHGDTSAEVVDALGSLAQGSEFEVGNDAHVWTEEVSDDLRPRAGAGGLLDGDGGEFVGDDFAGAAGEVATVGVMKLPALMVRGRPCSGPTGTVSCPGPPGSRMRSTSSSR